MLLQVHDELIFEVPDDEVAERRCRSCGASWRTRRCRRSRCRCRCRSTRAPPPTGTRRTSDGRPVAVPHHAQRWPAKHPDRLQLYSLPTPNGVKVSIMLEETRAALRAAPGRHRQERELDAGIPVAQPERQDPGDHRSRRSGRQAARPVRIRRDPALSGRQDRQARPGRPGAALRDHPVGVLPDGVDRADVRPGRLLPQVRRHGDRGQAPAATATSTKSKRLLGVLETRLHGRAMDHGRRLHDRRHRRCSAGCAT